MVKQILKLVNLILILTAISTATIIDIPDDYPTIQQGIDSSSDGDTVLVQPGTYVENINFGGHNIILGSLFLTTDDTSYIEQTIIDGDSANSVVIFNESEDSTARITGFTITNGYGSYGGGVYCDHSSPTISHNNIIYNYACWGAGIYCTYSSPIILYNNITDNLGLG